jgi:hypothetical protein
MAKRKLEVTLTPIATQIGKAQAKMKSLKPRVSVADQKAIDLEIKKLEKFRKELAEFCGRMTHGFKPLKPAGGEK